MHGCPQKIYQGESQHFAYIFRLLTIQYMQLDFHKTRYPFYTTKNCLCYGNSHKHCTFLAQQCFFSLNLLFTQYKTT